MQAIKIRQHIDSAILHLPVPESMIGKNVEIIVLIESDDTYQTEKSERKPGSAKGLMTMSDDFEAPLDDEIIESFYRCNT